jgi:serpin B
MKRSFLCLLVTALLVTACASAPPAASGDTGVVYAKSDASRQTNPQVDPQKLESLVAGNTTFALNFYKDIQATPGNIVFSPLSLSLALSMTQAGAEGQTKEQMLQALALQDLGDEVHPAFNALLQALEASQAQSTPDPKGNKFQLSIANSLWGQSGFDFRQPFLDTLAKNYGAGIYKVDYVQKPDGARQAINAWVNDATAGKIPDLISQDAIDPLTRLVLANAIYFNGSWLYPFDRDATQKAPFTLLDGSRASVDTMHMEGQNLAYAQLGNLQAVRLPYLSQDFSMVLLVPDEGAFRSVEAGLNPGQLGEILAALSPRAVNLSMPKFDFAASVDAVEPLKRLGMTVPFDASRADFSGMTGGKDLHISDVLHKATVSVNENGTEAAAATAVVMSLTSAPSEGPVTLRVDRPFLFLIQHQPSGAILFMGRVLQP